MCGLATHLFSWRFTVDLVVVSVVVCGGGDSGVTQTTQDFVDVLLDVRLGNVLNQRQVIHNLREAEVD